MTATATDLACAGGYLRVRIGRTQFLMPATAAVQMSRSWGGDEPRSAASADCDLLVVALDETLHAAAVMATADCRLVLQSGSERVVVACDAAELVGPEGVKLYALPPCMITPESVFRAAASLEDNIHGVCRAEDLVAVLGFAAGRSTARAGDTP